VADNKEASPATLSGDGGAVRLELTEGRADWPASAAAAVAASAPLDRAE